MGEAALGALLRRERPGGKSASEAKEAAGEARREGPAPRFVREAGGGGLRPGGAAAARARSRPAQVREMREMRRWVR